MTGDSVAPFTTESAARALDLAGHDAGVSTGNAQLIRMGENAIFALPDVVARVARSDQRLERVEKELAIARWLAHHNYPAVRVAEHLNQPIHADGRLITFWQKVAIAGEAGNNDLAALLRDFHALPSPEYPLPQFDPFSAVPGRLAAPGNAAPADVTFLTGLYDELRSRYATLKFPEPAGVIHGDAHLGNVIPTASGPILSDFEVVARGPWQWDITTTAMTVDRFAMPTTEYESFARIYGRDVTDQPEYPTLRAVRELTMVTWLMQIVDVSPQHAKEFTHRVTSLRDGDLQRRWNVF